VDSNNNKERSQQVGMNNRTTGEEIDFSREEFVIYIRRTKLFQKKKKNRLFSISNALIQLFLSAIHIIVQKNKKDTSSKNKRKTLHQRWRRILERSLLFI
jgi:hypothetical protein